jgi:ParB family chromosome partitioning protein
VSAKRSGLGRGLDALLPKSDKVIQHIETTRLRVSEFQPRKKIDPVAIAELANSIAEKGVLQPLVVRPSGSDFEIVAGERRFRASKQAGLKTIPAIVKDLSDQETLEVAIIENLQREDLNAAEEARAFKLLMDFGLSQADVAKAVGKSRSAIANALRLLRLSSEALAALEAGTISAGHARAILAQAEEDQDWALAQIIRQELSVREAEQLRRKKTTSGKKKDPRRQSYAHIEKDLTRHTGTRVKISGGNRGRIELHFHSQDELQRLIELLGYQA